MQLQGIVHIFIQLQGNDILVNCQGNTDSFNSKNICLFTKSIIIRGNYILTRNYIHFKEPYQLRIQGNISSFNENIFIQGNCIHSRKYVHLTGRYIRSSSRPYVHSRKLYLLNIVAFAEEQKYVFKNCPQPLYDNYKLYNYYILNKV